MADACALLVSVLSGFQECCSLKETSERDWFQCQQVTTGHGSQAEVAAEELLTDEPLLLESDLFLVGCYEGPHADACVTLIFRCFQHNQLLLA